MFVKMYEEKFMRFPQGKAKAVTFSYDDGVRADAKLMDIFAQYGLKGTFNLNSKRFDCPDWNGRLTEEEAYSLYSAGGQEIALHGARHAFLDKLPIAEALKEIADNRAYLEDKFNVTVRGMAYAYGAYNAQIKRLLADCGVVYARTTQSTYRFSLPTDFLEWHPTCHHADPRLSELADDFFGGSPTAIEKHREPWLFYLWGHSYEFDNADNWEVIRRFCARCADNEKDVWFATNIEIYEYVTAYNRLVYSFDGERVFNPSALPVWVEVRGKTYRIDGGASATFDKP